jgi:phosphohistidine swiveling domain-containing protein
LVHPISYFSAATSGRVKQLLGVEEESWLIECKNRAMRMCVPIENFVEQSEVALKKLGEKSFLELISRNQRKSCKELLDCAFFLREQDFSKYSNKELWLAFKKLFELFNEMNVWGNIPNLADFEHFMLSNKLTNFLEQRVREEKLSLTVADVFATLTTNTEKTLLQKQEQEFYALLAMIQSNPLAREVFQQPAFIVAKKVEEFPEIDRALHEFVLKYDWLQFHYDGPTVLGEEYFIELFSSEVRQGAVAGQRLIEIKEKEGKLKQKQEHYAQQLRLTPQEKHWFALAQEFMYLKGLRKDVVFLASRNSDSLVREIAARLKLNPMQVRHMTPQEIRQALVEGKRVEASELNERISYSVWITEKGVVKVFTGREAERYSRQLVEEAVGEVSELRGTPACAGYAKGAVKIIISAEEMGKMNQGDILVSPATNPNLVPAMRKAAAIITDAGGLTCHAAIVSRELGIPCVVGTRIATRALKDGDLVEVDATSGMVRKVS